MADLQVTQFLIEFDTYDDTDGVVPVYVATGRGYATSNSDTPSEVVYLPLVLNAGTIDEFLFSPASTTGVPSVSTGFIDLNNASRRLDFLRDRGVDGRPISIKERKINQTASTSTTRFVGTIENLSFSDRSVRIGVKSQFYTIKTDTYQPEVYAGTNDSSTIYTEGTEDGIGGSPKPKLLGNGSTGNMPAVLVDRGLEMYQLSSDPIASIEDVYVGRAAITAGTVHSTISSLEGATVASGEYDYYLGDYEEDEGENARGCYIRLGTTPSKQVTFDAVEGWQNEFLYSEDLSNAAWSKVNVTASQPGDKENPDGTGTDTYFLAENTATNFHGVTQDFAFTSGRKVTMSAIVAAKERTRFRLAGNATGVGSGNYCDFDLDAVTVAEVGNATGTIEAVGVDGFYKCTTTFTAAATGTHSLIFYLANASGGIFYAGTSGEGIYVFSLSAEESPISGTYKKTTSAAVYNNSWADLVWKIMNQRGYSLNLHSVLIANAVDDSEAYHFQSNSETTLEDVFTPILESAKAAIYSEDGVNKILVFSVPASADSVKTLDPRTLLGSTKVKYLSNNDETGGVPSYKTNIKYQKNYTVMREADVFGTSELTDIPFISEEYRIKSAESSATQTKHLNSDVKETETALADATDAAARATKELSLYGSIRLVVEVKIPLSIGADLPLGSAFTVEGRVYRVIGRKYRFLSSRSNGVTASAVSLQGWGGVIV